MSEVMVPVRYGLLEAAIALLELNEIDGLIPDSLRSALAAALISEPKCQHCNWMDCAKCDSPSDYDKPH